MSDDEFRKHQEIDHCRPLATFDLSDQENQFIAFLAELSTFVKT